MAPTKPAKPTVACAARPGSGGWYTVTSLLTDTPESTTQSKFRVASSPPPSVRLPHAAIISQVRQPPAPPRCPSAYTTASSSAGVSGDAAPPASSASIIARQLSASAGPTASASSRASDAHSGASSSATPATSSANSAGSAGARNADHCQSKKRPTSARVVALGSSTPKSDATAADARGPSSRAYAPPCARREPPRRSSNSASPSSQCNGCADTAHSEELVAASTARREYDATASAGEMSGG